MVSVMYRALERREGCLGSCLPWRIRISVFWKGRGGVRILTCRQNVVGKACKRDSTGCLENEQENGPIYSRL